MWRHSPGHCKAQTSRTYTEVGVGIHRGYGYGQSEGHAPSAGAPAFEKRAGLPCFAIRRTCRAPVSHKHRPAVTQSSQHRRRPIELADVRMA